MDAVKAWLPLILLIVGGLLIDDFLATIGVYLIVLGITHAHEKDKEYHK